MKKRTTILTALTLTGILITGCAAGTTQISRIDLDTAKAAAVEAAGLTESDVTFHSAELDRRNGIEYYDIDFVADGKEYDYDIDALTGTVIGSESPKNTKKASDLKPEEAAAKEIPAEEAPVKSEDSKSENSAKISEEEAKKIALAQVPGAKESDIRGFEIDYDDGRLEYEGSIYFEEMEYEFEIDGYSGAIRSWEAESIYD